LRRFEEGVAAERWTSGLRADPPSTFVPRLAPPLQVALEKEGYARVKLKRRKSGYLAVAGRVNRKEFNLLIDTGAPVTHLDRKRTERLGLKWEVQGGGLEPALEKRPALHAFVDSIELGTFRTGRLKVGEHDLSENNRRVGEYGDPPSDGLLGADILAPNLAVIDYKSCELFVLSRESGD
jgi:hypothetical protein